MVDLVRSGDGFAFLWTFSIQETEMSSPVDTRHLPYTSVGRTAERIPDAPPLLRDRPLLDPITHP